MRRSRSTAVVAAALAVASVRISHADVRADQQTKFQLAGPLGRALTVFGGKGARDGVVSSVAVKGGRKMTLNDAAGQIVDLSEEKIYDLDVRGKTYRVTTFEELRRRIEEARRKAEEDARTPAPSSGSEAAPAQDAKQLEVDFEVRNTGETKRINGFDTHQSIATVTVREKGKTVEQSGGVIMTADLWLAPRIAAMKEIQEFEVKYAQQLYGPMIAGASAQEMGAALALYPLMKPALAKWAAEAGKLDGTPILTTVTMDAVKFPEQLAGERQASQDDKLSNARSVGGLLGGLARKAAKKDEEPKARTTFLTTTNEVLKVTASVTADDVAVPVDFKQVE